MQSVLYRTLALIIKTSEGPPTKGAHHKWDLRRRGHTANGTDELDTQEASRYGTLALIRNTYAQYADALAKGHGVNLLHAETTGALGAIFMTVLRVLAKQSRLPGATDFTQYGEGRASRPRSQGLPELP